MGVWSSVSGARTTCTSNPCKKPLGKRNFWSQAPKKSNPYQIKVITSSSKTSIPHSKINFGTATWPSGRQSRPASRMFLKHGPRPSPPRTHRRRDQAVVPFPSLRSPLRSAPNAAWRLRSSRDTCRPTARPSSTGRSSGATRTGAPRSTDGAIT